MAISFERHTWLFAKAHKGLFEECAALYSEHYGTWAAGSPRAGQRVRLSPRRISDHFRSQNASIAVARDDGRLVGYAIAVQPSLSRLGRVSWVTQLVVQQEYRNKGIATRLLYSIWGNSDDYSWGVVSANPFAIRALEKATRRRADPKRIARHSALLLKLGDRDLTYVNSGSPTLIRRGESRINTRFPIDHSHVDDMIRRVSSDSLPWTLGDLPAGWEWFAFTFRDQPPLELTKEEIEEMLATAEDVTRQAYARMSLTKEHKWKRHAGNEAKFIVRECRLPRGSTVLDLGCGDGRHSIALSTMGCRVLGVDYVESLIERARAASRAGRLPDVRFETDDARTFDAGEVFDSVNCLYDVIGSFGDKSSNFQIVRNVAKHLKPGGRALVSVMNRVLTEKNAIHRFTFSGEPNRLLALHASRTMETSGNVFDPRFYLIDTDTGVVYRKEQFENGTDLPAEYIVSDRRFTPKEIADQFRAVGLQVETVKCVRAGDWETALADDDDRAKEILVLCRKGE